MIILEAFSGNYMKIWIGFCAFHVSMHNLLRFCTVLPMDSMSYLYKYNTVYRESHNSEHESQKSVPYVLYCTQHYILPS